MGQQIVLSGVSFFFAACYGTTHPRENHHPTLLIYHLPATRPHCLLPAPPRRFYAPDGGREGALHRFARWPRNASLSRNGTEQFCCSAIRRITA
jgi:hypothetical protein